MLNKYKLVEFHILKYLHASGVVWKPIGSTPGWNERFECDKYMELPTIIIAMFENEYFDLPGEINNYRIALMNYRNSDMTQYDTIKRMIAQEFNLGTQALIAAKGISYLRELEEKMSPEEIKPQIIQQFFAPVKNVTGSGDIHNTEIVIEKFFNNLIERITDLSNKKKVAIKRQLPRKVKEFVQSISTISFSALLNWFLSNVKP